MRDDHQAVCAAAGGAFVVITALRVVHFAGVFCASGEEPFLFRRLHGWIEKCFVYILRSDSNPARHYVGLTGDVGRRLEWHNAGQSTYTSNDRPWSVIVSIEFRDESGAARRETAGLLLSVAAVIAVGFAGARPPAR